MKPSRLLCLAFALMIWGCKSDNTVLNNEPSLSEDAFLSSMDFLSSSEGLFPLSSYMDFSSSSQILDGNIPPDGYFVSPLPNQTLAEPATFTVDIAANDLDGSIASVSLFINNVPLQQLVVPPFIWNANSDVAALINLPQGVYVLTAIITDNLGATQVRENVIQVVGTITPMSSSIGFPSSSTPYPNSSWTFPSSSSSQLLPLSSSIYIPPISSQILPSSSTLPPPSSAFIPSSSSVPTTATGTVSISYTPVDDKGTYSPRNANATWIQQGNSWVTNITAHAQRYARFVNLWRAVYTKTITTGVDGVAGASQNSFVAQSGTWNVTGKQFGTYRLYMQFATSNANGKSAYVDFPLRATGIDTTIASPSQYFKNVRITHTP